MREESQPEEKSAGLAWAAVGVLARTQAPTLHVAVRALEDAPQHLAAEPQEP